MNSLKILGGTLLVLMLSATAGAAPSSDLDPYWQSNGDSANGSVDHSLWQGVLDDYLAVEDDGLNRVDYAGIKADSDPRLDQYIEQLTSIDPRQLSGDTQMAYWINLYNALTVDLIVDNYPVKSITKLGGGFFTKGPWDDDIATITGRELTLNDIEHRILRPIFNDYRIHFAVNCASIGCPDLGGQVFSAESLDAQLDQLTRNYLAAPRGLEFSGEDLRLSKIFDWYRSDFGANEMEMLGTLANHVDEATASKLRGFNGDVSYVYDWSLNEL